MSWERCETCGEFQDLDRHVCAPAWTLYLIEDRAGQMHVSYLEEDVFTVHAYSAEGAAEKWAHRYDEDWGGEYPIATIGETDLTFLLVVHKDRPETRSIVSVYGRFEPVYYANTNVYRHIPQEEQARLMSEV